MEELLVALLRDSHQRRPGSCQRNRRHSAFSLQVSRGSNTREKEEKENHVSEHNSTWDEQGLQKKKEL